MQPRFGDDRGIERNVVKAFHKAAGLQSMRSSNPPQQGKPAPLDALEFAVHCSISALQTPHEGTMATGKTSTLTFRIEPALKEALRSAADREHRSIANMVEVIIRDHCGRVGVDIAEQLSSDAARQAATTRKKSPRAKKTA